MRTTVLFLAASLLSSVYAGPLSSNTEEGKAASPRLYARDKVKFNQYANLQDCKTDKNILYHAAPVSGRCYDIDDKTGAFFYNSAGFTQVYLYTNKGCTGNMQKLPIYGGVCLTKDDKNSIIMW